MLNSGSRSSSLSSLKKTRSAAYVYVSWMALILSFALASPVLAQKDAGTIVGTVRDAMGAVVTNATVSVVDLDHGGTFDTTSNDSGEYVAGPLKIGHYTVTVQKEGFKKSVAGPPVLNVQDRLVVDVTLQLGARSETIEVKAGEVQLQTQTFVRNSLTPLTIPIFSGGQLARLDRWNLLRSRLGHRSSDCPRQHGPRGSFNSA